MAGITDAGFVSKTREEIFNNIQSKFRTNLSSDWDEKSNNTINILTNIISEELSEAWSGFGTVYDSISPSSASSIGLDNNVALSNIRRVPDSKSSTVLEFTGIVGTVVPEGTIVENSQTKERFSTTTTMTLASTQFSDITLSVSSVLDSTVYSLTVDSVVVSINSGIGATANSILSALQIELVSDVAGVTCSLPTSTTLRINVTEQNSNLPMVVGAGISISSVSDLVNSEAVNFGNVLAPIGTITNLLVPIGGITSVTNLVDGEIGRFRESDSELRVRRYRTVTNPAIATYNAIYSKLYNLPDVEYVNIIDNPEASTNSDGVPTKAFEVIVEGGDLDEIASIIFENSPIAIQTHGTISKVVTDLAGNPVTVRFSRPTPVYIHVNCTYKLYAEEKQTASLNAKMSEIIVTEGNTLSVGEDVIQERFFGGIYSGVSGVGKLTISTAKSYDGITPITPFTEDTMSISRRELPIFRSDLTTVQQV